MPTDINPENYPAIKRFGITKSEDYWNALINEHDAANFLGLSNRRLRDYRSKGIGPEFIKISTRCVRYTRRHLNAWAEERIRTSTRQT